MMSRNLVRAAGLVSLAGAALAQPPTPALELSGAPSVFSSVLQLRGFALAIVVVLTVLSLVSWAVIIGKSRELSAVYRAGRVFLGQLREGIPVSALASIVSPSPLPRLAGRALEAPPGDDDPERRLRRLTLESHARLESKLSILATVASIAPSLGLLGTVYGIMETFLAIGATGSTSISVVAPGVADALLTTLFGLAVAIPAVAGYNHCVRRLRRIYIDLDNGVSEIADRPEVRR